MSEISPQRRSSDTVYFTGLPKGQRSFQRNAFSENFIDCKGLNACQISVDTSCR